MINFGMIPELIYLINIVTSKHIKSQIVIEIKRFAKVKVTQIVRLTNVNANNVDRKLY